MTKLQNPSDAVSRRALIGGTGALAFAAGARRASAASDNVLKVGFVSPRTGALAGFGETDGYVLQLARKALAKGLAVGGTTYDVQILDRDTQSDPSRASQLAKIADQRRPGRPDAGGLDARDHQSGRRRLRGGRACRACPRSCRGRPGISAAAPSPASPRRSNGPIISASASASSIKTYVSQWNLIPTNKKVGVLYPNDADGNAIRANLAPLLAKAGLHHRRSRPLRGRHHRLFRADRDVQAEQLRDLQLLPDPAGLRGVLAAGGAAGLRQAWSRSARPPRPACSPARSRRSADLGYDISQRRLLAQGLPLQVVADGRLRRASSPTATSRPRASNGRSSSARAWRCSMPAVAALQASADAARQGRRRPALSTLKADDDRRHASTSPPGRCPTSRTGPIIGTQWVKAPAGCKFKLDYVVTEHATDPNVPIERQARCRIQRRDGREAAHVRLMPISACVGHRQALRRAGRARRRRFQHAARTRRWASSGRTGPARRPCSACSSGAHAAEAGTVAFASHDVTRLAAAERCRRGIVRTHQIPRPFAGMTVFENVFVAAAHGGGFARAEAYDRGLDALRLCGDAGARQPARRDARAARPQAAGTGPRAGDRPEAAAAGRDRRRPDRRRGRRAGRHHPRAARPRHRASSGSSTSSMCCCRSPSGWSAWMPAASSPTASRMRCWPIRPWSAPIWAAPRHDAASASRRSMRGTACCRRCAASILPWSTARRWRWSAPTAPARPRCCAPSPARTCRPAGGCCSAAPTSPRLPAHRARGAGHRAGARGAAAVRADDRRREPEAGAGRRTAWRLGPGRRDRGLSQPAGAPQRAAPARCRAASSRRRPSAAR